MSRAKLKASLFQHLDGIFATQGFHRTSGKFWGEQYLRDDGAVLHKFQPSLRPRGECLELTIPFVSIRIHAVQEMEAAFEEPHPLTTEEGRRQRSTITKSLSRLGGLWQKAQIICGEQDVPDAADKMGTWAIGKGKSFFHEFADRSRILAVLTSTDDNYARSMALPDESRAMRAVSMSLIDHGLAAAYRVADEKAKRLKGEHLAIFDRWMARFRVAHPLPKGH